MVARTQTLDEVQIASPCHVAWDDMIGTRRVRYCHQCRLSVYNLSAMSREEAESMIQGREGRLCVRFFRRADGTMLTQDCPIGRRHLGWWLQGRWVMLGTALASLATLFIGVAALGFERRGQSLRKLEPLSSLFELLSPSPTTSTPVNPPLPVLPATPPVCVMGEMAAPVPPPPIVPAPIEDELDRGR